MYVVEFTHMCRNIANVHDQYMHVFNTLDSSVV